MRAALLTATVVLASLAAGCGEKKETLGEAPQQAQTTPSVAAEGPAPKPQTGAQLKIVSSEFGRVVADKRGEALYLFDKEKAGKSECYGECAKAWPPLLTEGEPRAAAGADQKLLGTTKRRDGKLQVTYRGQPLYYYVHDEPGKILCQNVPEFGGTWLVVQPDGRPVT